MVADDGQCDEIESSVKLDSKGTTELCLFPEVVKGDCIDIGGADEMESKVACADTEGERNVVKVVKANYGDSKAKCPKQAVPMQNVTRGATLCLVANA